MKEELTTAMHSEFTVSVATDTKHKVWAIIERAKSENTPVAHYFELYGINQTLFDLHKDSYFK